MGAAATRQRVVRLLAWYDRAKREMPWRNTRDPYAIWVSETMLQQTQVATVVPYYLRFLERFPTPAALAAADLSDVLVLWAGLGYYRRAKHLHAGAREVLARHGGRVPGTFAELLALPGIGRYTAGAIGSIAFNLPVPVVDGNVMRVLARVYGYDADIGVAKNQAFFWDKANTWVTTAPADTRPGDKGIRSNRAAARRHGDVNQALMELGATVCTPAAPKCTECPLRAGCIARYEGRQAELPVKAAKKAMPVVRRVALVILRQHGDQQEVLLMERPAGGLWEHMWEFPTIDPHDDPHTVLHLKLKDTRARGEVRHQLTHRTMVYQVMQANALGSGQAQLPVCDSEGRYVASRWVEWPLTRRHTLPMARAVHKIAAACR